MEKLIKGIFFVIFSIIGCILGWNLYTYTLPLFVGASQDIIFVNKVIMITLGLITGIACSSAFSGFVLKIIDNYTKKILAMPLKQLAGSGAGLIAGLIIAALSIFIASVIPLDSIPAGKFIFASLALVFTVFICYISIFFGARIIGKVPISSKMLKSPHGLDMFWGTKYKLLDTSVIIDGRIYDIAKTGFIEGTIAVPRFVLAELQTISDSADEIKRGKGRRGLDMLDLLKKDFGIEIMEKDYSEIPVDDKLVKLAQEMQAVLLTTDYNLNKVATVQGVEVLNINDLSNAVKPSIIPGEILKVNVLKEGKEVNQGIAYLENGTMIVIDNGKKHIGSDVVIEATSCLQTSAGKMIFAKIFKQK